MQSLSGSYAHVIDGKNRTRVPAKFKSALGEAPLMITKGIEKCLYLMPEGTIEQFWLQVNEDKEMTPLRRQALRAFSSTMFNIDEDPQGRFTIPQKLREYAGIKKEVIFVGFNNKIELWDSEQWDKFNASCTDDDMLSCLAKYGL